MVRGRVVASSAVETGVAVAIIVPMIKKLMLILLFEGSEGLVYLE